MLYKTLLGFEKLFSISCSSSHLSQIMHN